MKNTFKVPIVYLCFNRPDLSEQTLSRIAEINPEKILVISDGPRAGNSSDLEKVEQQRMLIDKKLGTQRLMKRYSEKNLGCKMNVSSGLTWAFSNVNRAIIIEDDCLPDLSFFKFCEAMLEKYADDESIAHISGSNLLASRKDLFSNYESDYFFSRFPFIWGWATWARAWKHYDVSMASWLKLSPLEKAGWGPSWAANFESVANGSLDTWDFQWVYSVLSRKMKNVMSVKNLISNLGFRDDATHTRRDSYDMSQKPLQTMGFPLKLPAKMAFYDSFDREICRHVYGPNTFEPLYSPLRFKIKNFMRTILRYQG